MDWPFKHLTQEQAWAFVHAGIGNLNSLSTEATLELSGLSAFGKSGNAPQFLSMSVEPITRGGYPGQLNREHVRSALARLGIPEP